MLKLCYFGIFVIFVCMGITIVFSYIDARDKDILKISEYEKILNREFGRTFESYNDYLVYKIEVGG